MAKRHSQSGDAMSGGAAPKVSVVMSVYNGEKYLREAIDSILAQTFEDFEFIIINDGSTDGTANILKEFPDPRIRIFENAKNEGLTRSLIRGCKEAPGKYIARMDADDISYPDRFQKQVEFLNARPEVGLVGSAWYYIDPQGNTFGEISFPLEHESILEDVGTFNPFIHGSVMFRAAVYNEVGGYREFFQQTQDYDLWLRFAKKTRIANLPDFLYMHRHHDKKIAVKNVRSQNTFAHIARKFSKMRDENGLDPLMIEDEAAIESIIEEMNPRGWWAERRMMSQYYADVAQDLYRAGLRISHLSSLFLYSLTHNPFNRTIWNILLSNEFRKRITRSLWNRTFRSHGAIVKK